jgi:NADH dehydrogenase/NADH:ubiquinone oxidoreductase subunit G
LWRDTATWLRGDPLSLLDSVPDGLELPAALLVHPSLVADGRPKLEALAKRIGASGDTGMLGAPILGANGRGAQELAPDLIRSNPDSVMASPAVLAIGDESWADLPTGSFSRLIVATSQPVPDDPRIDLVLPMAHAYERQATIINLEGRPQAQEGGAAAPPHARADWGIVAHVAQRLGLPGPSPDNLDVIRSFIADEHPWIADALRPEVLIARV